MATCGRFLIEDLGVGGVDFVGDGGPLVVGLEFLVAVLSEAEAFLGIIPEIVEGGAEVWDVAVGGDDAVGVVVYDGREGACVGRNNGFVICPCFEDDDAEGFGAGGE